MHKNLFYNPIFEKKKQKQIASICKELLYIDYYFTKKFVSKYDDKNKTAHNFPDLRAFTHVARTICIAFTALAARYSQGNLTDKNITSLVNNPSDTGVYEKLRDIGNIKYLLPLKLYTDTYDATLDKLFSAIIEEGFTEYSYAHDNKPSLTAANFLKKDENYYDILRKRWPKLGKEIREIFKSSK